MKVPLSSEVIRDSWAHRHDDTISLFFLT